ncbi:MAG: DUF1206 domain-containing protein [Pseudomonadota bacterium]|nr:DUF1206 domain-containing protein [Pseudomonadota bacterium]
MQPNNKLGVLETLARWGYGARGAVYLIVGGLAFADAFYPGQESVDTKGALQKIISQPFGDVLLGLVAVGLVGYALWRVVQAVADVDGHGSGFKGVAVRGGLLISAVTHVLLAFFAVSLIFGWGTGNGGGDDSAYQDWTARLLSQEFGQWLVAGVGAVIVLVGIVHMTKGFTSRFKKYVEVDRAGRWADPVCRFGLVARGVVFAIIGGFFVVAALHFSSGEVKGLKGALNVLETQPFGPWLLGAVGLGLVAFAVYSFIEAAYRRINPPDIDVEAIRRAV